MVEGAAAAATPWVEKYRPKSLSDVSHQNEVVSTLQNAVATGRLPHLLLYGPPGSGKTSVALALCRQLWHPDHWRRRVLELNASDERGISVVRDKIKHFASLSVGNVAPDAGASKSKQRSAASFFKKTSAKDDNDEMDVDDDSKPAASEDVAKYPNPPFKIIILDEADTVTTDAQAALRRIIEAHSRITRFILICNYVTRIIEPLASRCAKFRFQLLPPASMKARLEYISQVEGCLVKGPQLDTILEVAEGDMRRAVTTLQSVHALGTEVNDDDISELAGRPPPSVVDRLFAAMNETLFDKMKEVVEDICAMGYSVQALLTGLLDKVIVAPELDEIGRSRLAIRISQAEKNMIDGADEFLQLMTVCGLGMQCVSNAKTDGQ